MTNKADERLGYVVRQLVEGVQKRRKYHDLGNPPVVIPVVTERAGMCQVSLTIEEVVINPPDKLDAIVAQKLAMLDTVIEEMASQTEAS